MVSLCLLFLQSIDDCKQCVAGYYCPNLANYELTACEVGNYSVKQILFCYLKLNLA